MPGLGALRPQDALRLVMLGAVWGSSYLLIKVGLQGIPPVAMVGARVAIGALLLLVVLAVRGLRFPRRELWPALLFMAVVANLIPFTLIAWGEEHTSSSLAAILNSTTPLFTVLIALGLLREERAGPLRLAGIAAGFAGVGIIVGGGPAASSLIADGAIVLAALAYAFGFIVARRTLTGRGHSPVEIAAGQLTFAAVVMAPAMVWDGMAHGVSPTPVVTVAVALLGALGTGIAYLLYYRLVSDTGATTASFVTYLIPVFGAAFGWLFLHESLGYGDLAGAVLVLAGIVVAERARRHSPSPPAPAPAEPCTADRR